MMKNNIKRLLARNLIILDLLLSKVWKRKMVLFAQKKMDHITKRVKMKLKLHHIVTKPSLMNCIKINGINTMNSEKVII